MRKLIFMLVPFLTALALATGASAHIQWTTPGLHPYSDSYEKVMEPAARKAAFEKLGLSGEALEKVMAATATRGDLVPLRDRECFDAQLYQNGRVEHDVCVAFGDKGYNRKAERWSVTLADGTVIEVTHPYVCHNLSIRIIRPPAKPPCGAVEVVLTKGDIGIHAYHGYWGTFKSNCPAYKRPSDAKERPINPDCGEAADCLSDVSEIYGKPRRVTSVTIDEPGVWTFYVPVECTKNARECTFALCLESPDYQQGTQPIIVAPSRYSRKTLTARIENNEWVSE